jgi:hypothetical protein
LADFLKDFPSVSREMAVQCIEDAEQLFLAAALGNSDGQQTRAERPAPRPAQNLLGLLELKGIGKEMFAESGGGEEFLRNERRAFAEGIEKQDRERGLL